MGEAALGLPPQGLRAVLTACLPSAPLGRRSPGEARVRSAEWVLLTASGMVLMPWALQEATGALGGAGPQARW